MTNLNLKNISLLSILSVTLAYGQQNVTKGCFPCCIKDYKDEMEEKSEDDYNYEVIYDKEKSSSMEEISKIAGDDIVYFKESKGDNNKILKGTVKFPNNKQTANNTKQFSNNKQSRKTYVIEVNNIMQWSQSSRKPDGATFLFTKFSHKDNISEHGEYWRNRNIKIPLRIEKIIRKKKNT